MRQTAPTTRLSQTSETAISSELFDMPEVTIDLGSESDGWLDVYEGSWVTEWEPLSADGINELYALAEELSECVSHTESDLSLDG